MLEITEAVGDRSHEQQHQEVVRNNLACVRGHNILKRR
jgi:hypothetical protein